MLRKLFATTILSAVTILLVTACSQRDGSCCGYCGGKGSPPKSDPSPPSSAVEAVYVCPMHPEVRQGSSGKCPKCGMDLERQQ